MPFLMMLPWKWIGLGLAVVAIVGGAWFKGDMHGKQVIQDRWNLDTAQKELAAVALAKEQQAATLKRIATYEDRISALQSAPAVVVHDRIVRYVGRMCSKPVGGPGAVLPAGPGVGTAGAGADPTVRPTDSADLQSDIEASERNAARLAECAGWVRDNGGAKP